MKLHAALAAAALLTGTNAQIPDGSLVPDVTAYTSDGTPFDLRDQLNGHHSVIVFGCLT